MTNDVLISLLKEYERKRLNAENELELRKKQLYDLIPRLREIDNELNNMAISTAKNILMNNTKSNNSKVIDSLNNNIARLKKEKEEILKKNNYDLNYLEPMYECNLCKDTGYITDSNFNTVMCSCLKQKLLDESFNKSNMYNIKKENFSTFNENLYSDKPDSKKYKFEISPRENILNIRNKCMTFIENFDNPDTKNLLFTGSTGLR